VTGVGLTIGIVLTVGLNLALAQFMDVDRVAWPIVVLGMLALWAIGLAAALAPAIRGTTVSPVVATRSV
jgi:putative ABC transport system permease protein